MQGIMMIILYAAAYLTTGFVVAKFSKWLYDILTEIKVAPKKQREILLVLFWPLVLGWEILSAIFGILAAISGLCASIFGCGFIGLIFCFLNFLDFFFSENAKKNRVKLSPDISLSEPSENEPLNPLSTFRLTSD